MTMGWPTRAETFSNTVRGKRSVALPGENGTITCTRFVGHGAGDWARRAPPPMITDAAAMAARAAALRTMPDVHLLFMPALSSPAVAPTGQFYPPRGTPHYGDRPHANPWEHFAILMSAAPRSAREPLGRNARVM
jgi:hypothetical protein